MEPRREPINDDEKGILDYLRGMVMLYEMTPNMIAREEGLRRYKYLLEHGQFFTPEPRLRKPYRKMPDKMCWRNATFMVQQYADLRYVEGLAVSMFPTPHAWVTNGDGAAIDPTWTKRTKDKTYPPLAYFGVVKTAKELGQKILESERYTAHWVP